MHVIRREKYIYIYKFKMLSGKKHLKHLWDLKTV